MSRREFNTYHKKNSNIIVIPHDVCLKRSLLRTAEEGHCIIFCSGWNQAQMISLERSLNYSIGAMIPKQMKIRFCLVKLLDSLSRSENQWRKKKKPSKLLIPVSRLCKLAALSFYIIVNLVFCRQSIFKDAD